MVNRQEITAFFHQLKSIPFVQTYLQNCYLKHEYQDSERLSFENADRFIYYLEHAETYLQQAKNVPISIQPVLLFYGMTQLIKTCLLTVRPHYPENTSLLAHGVSTRKRKKQSYLFLQDEVKIQQNGLFPYFTNHLFDIQQLPKDKFSMNSLYKRIPEMNDLFQVDSKENEQFKIGHYQEGKLQIPEEILNEWHISESRFIQKINMLIPQATEVNLKSEKFSIDLSYPLYPFESNTLYLNMDDQHYYLMKNRQYTYPFHEVMAHFLLLYNLSMICRYETEWWGELLHTYGSNDYPFILHFLNITAKKTPIMLGYYLYNQNEKHNRYSLQ
ncbi:YaaC family protein [Salinibacillus xinjiangensis]|uniref:YaaC family protein n=1 Tax=Salinibacillus xinjiangensis TaxID=1229268 RepID=A0A6G1XAH5_9BACI|nr:YaaC family protein [Salinibacillus xinjiangensis]MRG87942.1 hypothetical protein [Salinibacillus xinjiangensis]